MATQRTIAVIGALEDAAKTVIKSLTKSGYRVLLFCKENDLSQLSSFATEKQFIGMDLEWMSCPIEASWEADMVLLAVPAHEMADVAAMIRKVAIGKPVFDIGYDGAGSEELQALLPHSVVGRASADTILSLVKPFFNKH
ncbi:MAG: NAD(P)-binding domain-containing protein [Chitinophagaceae bacterium]